MVRLRDRLNRLRGARGVTRLYINGGTVPCPLRGDVSVETCLACGRLRSVGGDPARIECIPGASSMEDVARHVAL